MYVYVYNRLFIIITTVLLDLMHACMNICMCVCNGRIDSEYDVERLQRWSGLCFGILLLDISGFGCARVLSLDRGDPHGGPGRLVMGMLLL